MTTVSSDSENPAGASNMGRPLEMESNTANEKLRRCNRLWLFVLIVIVVVFAVVVFVILLATDDDRKAPATLPPTESPTITPSTTQSFLQSISFQSNSFHIEAYIDTLTTNITKPRALRSAYFNGATIVYVGSSDFTQDRAYALVDYDSDGINDAEFIIFESSSIGSTYSPASLALSFDGTHSLYIAVTDALVQCDGNVHEQILAFTSMEDRLPSCHKIMNIPLTAEDASKSYNVRRYIGFSRASNELCMANGMTCDFCAAQQDDITFPHGTITCFRNLSESAMQRTNMSDESDANIVVKARGVRNSVGFDWHPVSDWFYFTDNGKDDVHEEYPDDELNAVVVMDNEVGNNNFGFPECHSLGSGPPNLRDVACSQWFIDPNISTIEIDNVNCSRYQNVLQSLGAHVVPLGMRFYTGTMFPDALRHTILIAERGSGDADSFGYRIAGVKLSEDYRSVVSHFVFADGWFDYDTEEVHGRPVDIEVLHDGSILISDDHSPGAIYRVSFDGDTAISSPTSTPSNANCDFSYVNINT